MKIRLMAGLALLLVFNVYAGTNLLLALLPPGRSKPLLCALSWLAVLASTRLIRFRRG
ncbi:hypothetical protein [Janthinobacterium sp. LB3P118]|uniref:hypothetical protein n=1 Tax=Janthinobacterium sp. LB3P118 TaxID=3424195 RepID=UPI003F227154